MFSFLVRAIELILFVRLAEHLGMGSVIVWVLIARVLWLEFRLTKQRTKQTSENENTLQAQLRTDRKKRAVQDLRLRIDDVLYKIQDSTLILSPRVEDLPDYLTPQELEARAVAWEAVNEAKSQVNLLEADDYVRLWSRRESRESFADMISSTTTSKQPTAATLATATAAVVVAEKAAARFVELLKLDIPDDDEPEQKVNCCCQRKDSGIK